MLDINSTPLSRSVPRQFMKPGLNSNKRAIAEFTAYVRETLKNEWSRVKLMLVGQVHFPPHSIIYAFFDSISLKQVAVGKTSLLRCFNKAKESNRFEKHRHPRSSGTHASGLSSKCAYYFTSLVVSRCDVICDHIQAYLDQGRQAVPFRSCSNMERRSLQRIAGSVVEAIGRLRRGLPYSQP